MRECPENTRSTGGDGTWAVDEKADVTCLLTGLKREASNLITSYGERFMRRG